MNKIIFCNVVWDVDYRGIMRGDDKDTNREDEYSLFLPHNHFCYGYVDDKDEQNKIKELVGDDEVVQDVTVIWTAVNTRGNRKIVGWYEHAEVFGDVQSFYDGMLHGLGFKYKGLWRYNIKAAEKNVRTIPYDYRRFNILDEDYDDEGFIDKVLKYISRNGYYLKLFDTDFFDTTHTIKELRSMNSYRLEQQIEQIYEYKHLQQYRGLKNMIETFLSEEEPCKSKFLRGKLFQRVLLYDEALELYKQFKFDYSQLNDEEKTEELKKYHLECLYNMATICMTLNDYFSACTLYQQYLDQIDDNEIKNKVLLRLMQMFDEEEDWQHLRESVVEYQKLNNAINETVQGYIDKLNNLQREAMFPEKMLFKGVKLWRSDTDEKMNSGIIRGNQGIIFKSGKTYIDYLNKNYYSENKIKIAIVTKWSGELIKFYERITKTALPEDVTKFPFDFDIAIVDAVLSDKIVTHSIFTEHVHIYNLGDFDRRDYETGSFKIDSADVEIYIADYSETNDDVIKHNGVIKYTDEDIDKLENILK